LQNKGFTLVETLVTAFILLVTFGALLMVLVMGNFSNTVGAAILPLRQEVRNITGWIIKDVHQTSSYQINNNSPLTSHIKFKVCTGHDGSNILWSSDFIEYTYDAGTQTLTRQDFNTGSTTQFSNIISAPFNTSGLVSNNKLTVTVHIRKSVLGAMNSEFSLTTEVKIRNG